MTAPEATDVIDRTLATFAAGPRCAIGVAGLALGAVAAIVVSRRLFAPLAAAPASDSAGPRPFLQRLAEGEPRSFRLELLPALFLVWIAAAFAAPRLFGGGRSADGSADLRAAAQALLFVAAIVVAFLVVWTRRLGDGLADLGVTARDLGRTLVATLVFYVALFPAQIGAGALESGLCELLGRAPTLQPAVLAFARDPSLHRDPLVVGALVLAAPLYEEILFRGVLLRYLQRVAPTALAVLIDAALFTGVHPGGFSAVFVLGVALAWLMAATRSIAAPICFHVVHNGLALVLIATTAG